MRFIHSKLFNNCQVLKWYTDSSSFLLFSEMLLMRTWKGYFLSSIASYCLFVFFNNANTYCDCGNVSMGFCSSHVIKKSSSTSDLRPKIQQTKMLVTCQRFGDWFLFGMVWPYSSNQKNIMKVGSKSLLLTCSSNKL